MDFIKISHGNGGEETKDLIENIFYKYFKVKDKYKNKDSAIINLVGNLAVTTDSFVVDPIFFAGGDIGKLSICGTINDISVSGAKPLYITAGFIIEEGLSLKELEKIVYSMAKEAEKNNIDIIAGDTKVVEKGKGDKIYINTTGIGVLEKKLYGENICEGDKIILSGSIAEHGICILNERENICSIGDIKSDCASVYPIVDKILSINYNVKFMRDPTRGGVAEVLNEISALTGKCIKIYEDKVPIKPKVKSLCKILGIDPLYVANEGKVLIVVSKEDANDLLKALKNIDISSDASIIGEVKKGCGVVLETLIMGEKKLSSFTGNIIPRIC